MPVALFAQQLHSICSACLCVQHGCLSSMSAASRLLQVAFLLQGQNGVLGACGPVNGPISLEHWYLSSSSLGKASRSALSNLESCHLSFDDLTIKLGMLLLSLLGFNVDLGHTLGHTLGHPSCWHWLSNWLLDMYNIRLPVSKCTTLCELALCASCTLLVIRCTHNVCCQLQDNMTSGRITQLNFPCTALLLLHLICSIRCIWCIWHCTPLLHALDLQVYLTCFCRRYTPYWAEQNMSRWQSS